MNAVMVNTGSGITVISPDAEESICCLGLLPSLPVALPRKDASVSSLMSFGAV